MKFLKALSVVCLLFAITGTAEAQSASTSQPIANALTNFLGQPTGVDQVIWTYSADGGAGPCQFYTKLHLKLRYYANSSDYQNQTNATHTEDSFNYYASGVVSNYGHAQGKPSPQVDWLSVCGDKSQLGDHWCRVSWWSEIDLQWSNGFSISWSTAGDSSTHGERGPFGSWTAAWN